MKKTICLIIGFSSFLFCVAQNTTRADSVSFVDSVRLQKAPNTDVFFIPPKYFEPDSSINGYAHKGSMATIQIIEVPNITIYSFEKKMTAKYFDSQGYAFKEKKTLKLDSGKDAILFFVSYNTAEFEYERIMFFIDSNKKMVWLNVTYPLIMKKLLEPAIEACLKSVQ